MKHPKYEKSFMHKDVNSSLIYIRVELETT